MDMHKQSRFDFKFSLLVVGFVFVLDRQRNG